MATRAERESWAHEKEVQLAEAIVKVALPGLGRMDSTWDLVEESSGVFHQACTAYIRGEATQQDVLAAGKKVLEVWRSAATFSELMESAGQALDHAKAEHEAGRAVDRAAG